MRKIEDQMLDGHQELKKPVSLDTQKLMGYIKLSLALQPGRGLTPLKIQNQSNFSPKQPKKSNQVNQLSKNREDLPEVVEIQDPIPSTRKKVSVVYPILYAASDMMTITQLRTKSLCSRMGRSSRKGMPKTAKIRCVPNIPLGHKAVDKWVYDVK